MRQWNDGEPGDDCNRTCASVGVRVANKFITLTELAVELRLIWSVCMADIRAKSMFIEGQCNWERAEFDEHG